MCCFKTLNDATRLNSTAKRVVVNWFLGYSSTIGIVVLFFQLSVDSTYLIIMDPSPVPAAAVNVRLFNDKTVDQSVVATLESLYLLPDKCFTIARVRPRYTVIQPIYLQQATVAVSD